MKTQLEKIEELISCLPKRDRGIAKKYLAERNFMEIFELAESNLKKILRKSSKESDEVSYNLVADLTKLRDITIDYAASITMPFEEDFSDIY